MILKQERMNENKILRDNGYRWTKQESRWILFAPDGSETTPKKALREIELGIVPHAKTSYNYDQRPAAQIWAQGMLDLGPLIADTETTGLGTEDQILEIAFVDLYGDIIFQSLIKPTCPIHPKAQETHHISPKMLENAPTFAEVASEIVTLLRTRHVIFYNSAFDLRLIRQSAKAAHISLPEKDLLVHCLMLQSAWWNGHIEPPTSPERCPVYQYPSLNAMAFAAGIMPNNAHRAADDAITALHVLKHLAK